MNSWKKIRIGTRGSKLALAQAKLVENLLIEKGYETEIIIIKSRGDSTYTPLRLSMESGIFTKDINRALQEGEIDMAVHSMKDIPTSLEENLKISSVIKRGPVEDFLVSRFSFFSLPKNSRIGTSSQRRRDFIKFLRPDLEVLDLRGNLDTRIEKYRRGEYEGIIVARAGLERLRIDIEGEILDKDIFVPQANQGAIAIVTRNDEFSRIAESVDDVITHMETMIEREALRSVNAGCHSSLGIFARYQNNLVNFHAAMIIKERRKDFYRSFSPDEFSRMLDDFRRWYYE